MGRDAVTQDTLVAYLLKHRDRFVSLDELACELYGFNGQPERHAAREALNRARRTRSLRAYEVLSEIGYRILVRT